MAIKEGYHVKVEYTGTLEDGSLFDSTEKVGSPLEFQIGAQQVIEGFENAVASMELDEEKDFTLQPSDAYGDYDDKMIQDIPRDRLPPEEIEAGMTLLATLPNGAQMPVTVKEVTDEIVKLDMNHPLAGKVLNFKIKVVGIKEGELCAGDCTPGCSCE